MVVDSDPRASERISYHWRSGEFSQERQRPKTSCFYLKGDAAFRLCSACATRDTGFTVKGGRPPWPRCPPFQSASQTPRWALLCVATGQAIPHTVLGLWAMHASSVQDLIISICFSIEPAGWVETQISSLLEQIERAPRECPNTTTTLRFEPQCSIFTCFRSGKE